MPQRCYGCACRRLTFNGGGLFTRGGGRRLCFFELGCGARESRGGVTRAGNDCCVCFLKLRVCLREACRGGVCDGFSGRRVAERVC